MQNNLIKIQDGTIYRILQERDSEWLVIDCIKRTMPKWIESLAEFESVPESVLCKRVGITHTLIKFMPLCKACIDEYAETDDEYHARIIVWAYRKLKAEKTNGEIIRVSEIHKLTSEWKENIIRALPYMAKFADQEIINEIDALAREKHWHRNLVD